MINQAPKDISIQINGNKITSSRKDWYAAVSLIRAGYVIETIDGGKATVISTSRTILYVNIEQPFRLTQYNSGEWFCYVPMTHELDRYLPELLSNTKLLPELYDCYQRIIDEVNDSVYRLHTCRDYANLDNSLVYKALTNLGIYIDSGLTNDISVYQALLREAINYYIYKGRKASFDYIGLGYGARWEIVQLWTKDYVSFAAGDEIPLNETNWYPTNNVRLIHTGGIFDEITQAEITELFYQLAWICWVLYDIVIRQMLQSLVSTWSHGVMPEMIEIIDPKDEDMHKEVSYFFEPYSLRGYSKTRVY